MNNPIAKTENYLGMDFIKCNWHVPEVPGLYLVCVKLPLIGCLYTNEQVVYVGSSNNVGKRVKSGDHPFRQISSQWHDQSIPLIYVRIFQTTSFESEKELIYRLQPVMNKQWR